jgi:hypothetical protein
MEPATGANDEAVQAGAGENLPAKPERDDAVLQGKTTYENSQKNGHEPDDGPPPEIMNPPQPSPARTA